MGVDSVRFFDDKKFVWDGKMYEAESEAKEIKAGYELKNFEVRMVGEEGKFVLYTRRVVTEIVLEGEAPPGV